MEGGWLKRDKQISTSK